MLTCTSTDRRSEASTAGGATLGSAPDLLAERESRAPVAHGGLCLGYMVPIRLSAELIEVKLEQSAVCIGTTACSAKLCKPVSAFAGFAPLVAHAVPAGHYA
jgi:hypothetical protein